MHRLGRRIWVPIALALTFAVIGAGASGCKPSPSSAASSQATTSRPATLPAGEYTPEQLYQDSNVPARLGFVATFPVTPHAQRGDVLGFNELDASTPDGITEVTSTNRWGRTQSGQVIFCQTKSDPNCTYSDSYYVWVAPAAQAPRPGSRPDCNGHPLLKNSVQSFLGLQAVYAICQFGSSPNGRAYAITVIHNQRWYVIGGSNSGQDPSQAPFWWKKFTSSFHFLKN